MAASAVPQRSFSFRNAMGFNAKDTGVGKLKLLMNRLATDKTKSSLAQDKGWVDKIVERTGATIHQRRDPLGKAKGLLKKLLFVVLANPTSQCLTVLKDKNVKDLTSLSQNTGGDIAAVTALVNVLKYPDSFESQNLRRDLANKSPESNQRRLALVEHAASKLFPPSSFDEKGNFKFKGSEGELYAVFQNLTNMLKEGSPAAGAGENVEWAYDSPAAPLPNGGQYGFPGDEPSQGQPADFQPGGQQLQVALEAAQHHRYQEEDPVPPPMESLGGERVAAATKSRQVITNWYGGLSMSQAGLETTEAQSILMTVWPSDKEGTVYPVGRPANEVWNCKEKLADKTIYKTPRPEYYGRESNDVDKMKMTYKLALKSALEEPVFTLAVPVFKAIDDKPVDLDQVAQAFVKAQREIIAEQDAGSRPSLHVTFHLKGEDLGELSQLSTFIRQYQGQEF